MMVCDLSFMSDRQYAALVKRVGGLHTLGQQLMVLDPDQRRCPSCVSLLMYQHCDGESVPFCAACGLMFSSDGVDDFVLRLDHRGVVIGMRERGAIDE